MVETVGFRQVLWLVMLESTMDRALGVETPGQQVPPRVWYETACLLIREAIGCESCSMVWGKTQNVILSTRCKRGSSHEEAIALQAET
jgi:hypothetical protein